MSKKKIIIIVSILVVSMVIAGLYGTLAASSTVTGTDSSYIVTLNGTGGDVVLPAKSSRTIIYQVTNTNKGTVQYGLAYSGDNVDVRVYYDSQDDKSGTVDYGENKFVKLYVENVSSSQTTAHIKTVMGYENGGNIDSLLPSGYSFVEGVYVSSSVNLLEYIKYLYESNYDSSKNVANVSDGGINYYAPNVNLMNDGYDSSGYTAGNPYVGNIRYYGSNPDNYIYFNCDDYFDTSTCEVWRIVGIVDGKVKIVSSSSVGKVARDYDYNNGAGATTYSAIWDDASLNTLLNGAYYNNSSDNVVYYSKNNVSTTFNFANSNNGIKNDDTRNLISKSKWYTYSENKNTLYPNQIYKLERTDKNIWTGNIALLSASDYAYASDLSTCKQLVSAYNNTNCVNTNWILPVITSNKNGYGWLINSVLYSWIVAAPTYGVTYTANAHDAHHFAPALYLDSDVLIRGGTGTSGNPYRVILGDIEETSFGNMPTCELIVSTDGITIGNLSTDIISYGVSTSNVPSYNTSSLALSTGFKYGHVKNSDGRIGICSVEITNLNGVDKSVSETVSCTESNYNNKTAACSNGYVYTSDTCSVGTTYKKTEYLCKKGPGMNYGWSSVASQSNLSYCSGSGGGSCTSANACDQTIADCAIFGTYKTECTPVTSYFGSITCNKKGCADGYTSVGEYCYK